MRLAYACPYLDSTPKVAISHMAATLMAARTNPWVDVIGTTRVPHQLACERILAKALANPDVEALFWTEDDCVLSKDAVTRLVKILEDDPTVDIATGITFMRKKPHYPMVAHFTVLTEADVKALREADPRETAVVGEERFRFVGEIDTEAAPYAVDAASMNCLLIRRSALEVMAQFPHPFETDSHWTTPDFALFRRLLGKVRMVVDPAVLTIHLGDREEVGVNQWIAAMTEAVAAGNAERLDIAPGASQAERALLRAEARGFLMVQRVNEIQWAADWLLSRAPLGRVLEIGTHRGGTAAFWSELGATVLAVDLPDGKFGGIGVPAAVARDEALAEAYPTYHCIHGDSHAPGTVADVATLLDGAKVDLLFIDGDHNYEGVRADLESYRHFVRPGGVVLFHDIKDTPFNAANEIGVPRLWRELEGEKKEFVDSSEWGGLGAIVL